ncbi:NMD3 domain-containing protein [Chloropicon primus]|uniref:60S ribosomal export protein NMD3 n=1 Tax=Chloropicon primus TaxID=1764295 RepID=A0A5B8MDU6_9CHLO|nr:NMD3 domain-containing protein [Chloropicon primus]UPQ97776.1 NMD3 domain-containing protein [Chloropicon primus]|mmetsp:Transcript_13249/g.37139  ORF Transcript_13249/g.37139 Transcript_13249/m.37139 type:complete len:536 (+) Transcript_13249:253-1860(+)|eukprot:QDZ18567.1 NMD3 domain-containing protein [Chloropicon primus]
MEHDGVEGGQDPSVPGPSPRQWPQATVGHVLCCLCGINIQPNPANMCVNCLKTQVDITEGIQRQVTILYCDGCGRYLQPPKHWLSCQLESKELLTFCIKRTKGLNRIKLIDASFIWTEPHSKRLKVKLTIQKDIFNGAILQHTFVVEYIVTNHMCDLCTKQAANPNQWVASVQVRQKVDHKRTFFFLEQLIIKHEAQANCVNIKNSNAGMDFFFGNRSHAIKFIDFLQNVVPIKHRSDKSLVSHCTKNNTYNYKYTFAVEIALVCKDDLVILPKKLNTALGNLGPLVLCTRVTNSILFTNPQTLQDRYLDAEQYWRWSLKALMNSRQLTEFIVLDIDVDWRKTTHGGRCAYADVMVAREKDYGVNDNVFHTRTHLGNLLQPGDTVLGYDMLNANLVDPNLDSYPPHVLMDVVLVRKSYKEQRARKRVRKGKRRNFKLKRLDAEEEEEVTRKKVSRNNVVDPEKEMEEFMDELEEDHDMRARINLYKAATGQTPSVTETDEEDEVPKVPLEELLDDMTLGDVAKAKRNHPDVDMET